MQRTFGSWVTRVLRGGQVLSDAEHHILVQLVAGLPEALRVPVEAQFDLYNLAQRESERRALNFYRVRLGQPGVLPVSPVLTSKLEVAPLIRVSFSVSGESEPLHAVLVAVGGRAFCISFSRAVPLNKGPSEYSVAKVTQAWHSNFDLASAAAQR